MSSRSKTINTYTETHTHTHTHTERERETETETEKETERENKCTFKGDMIVEEIFLFKLDSVQYEGNINVL